MSGSAIKTLAGYSAADTPYWIQAGREEPKTPSEHALRGASSVSYPRPDSNVLGASFNIGTRDEIGINNLN